jgi:hypothetical protein
MKIVIFLTIFKFTDRQNQLNLEYFEINNQLLYIYYLNYLAHRIVLYTFKKLNI